LYKSKNVTEIELLYHQERVVLKKKFTLLKIVFGFVGGCSKPASSGISRRFPVFITGNLLLFPGSRNFRSIT